MSKTQDLVRKTLLKYNELKYSSQALNFFCNRLETTSNSGIALFSGAIRDWYLGYTPKDIDFVIDTPYFKDLVTGIAPESHINSFGGYIFDFDGITIDLWNLKDTFAFKRENLEPTWDNLAKSASFNLDCLVIKLNGECIEYGFWNALESKTLTINNPYFKNSKQAAARALKIKKKYSLELSKDLNHLISDNLSISEISEIDENYCPPTQQQAVALNMCPEQLTITGIDMAVTPIKSSSSLSSAGVAALKAGLASWIQPSKKSKSSNSP